MPRRTAVAEAPPQKVNVSVDMPQAPVERPEVVKEERAPTWFWDMLQEIPKDKWGTEFDVLGFRIDPKPGVAAGAKGFLFQVFEAITPMWVKQNYGGGRFRCILEQKSRFKTSHEFEIEGQPKYDLTRELPNVPAQSLNGNGDFQKEFISVLREELARSREATQGTPQGTDKVVEMLSSASEKAMEIVTKQFPQAGTATGQIKELVGALKEMGIIGGATAPKSLLEEITSIIRDPTIGPLILKLFTPSDPLAELAKVKSAIEVIDGLRGGTGGSSGAKDWRAMLAEGLVQKGPELLREVRETFQENTKAATEKRAAAEAIERVEAARRNGAVPAAQPGAPSAVPTAHAVMPAGPLRTVPLDRSAPAEPAATPPAAPGMSAAETDAVGKFMEQRIVEMIRDDRDPEDVVDFIEDVDPTLNDMLVTYSADMVTTFLAGRPIIGQATQHPKWNDFLSAAQKYIKEIREEDKAIEAAAAAVPS